MVVKAIEVIDVPAGFFDVIELCRKLDAAHTNAFEKRGRNTRIYIQVDGPCFRVSHWENGITTAVAVHLKPDDDLALEIRSLHQVIDDRLRKQRCMEDEIRFVPF